MKPVNLLPERDRARRPTQGQSPNATYAFLGVLGLLLLAVVAYVSTQNQINSKTSEIAVVTQEKQEAEQRAAGLAAFGEFAQVKETRVQSVTDLAKSRFDWERLMRELALVLPEGTWLTDVTTSASGATDTDTAPVPTTPGTAPVAASPTLSLVGCSKSQERVAVMLVRLRKLHRAVDVQLTESAEAENTTGVGDGAPVPDAAGTGGQCAYFKFDATVTFEPGAAAVPEAENRSVPAGLGGGA